MATIEVLGWIRDFVGFTGWDAHAKSELKKRLRRGLNRSVAEKRFLLRKIEARESVLLESVKDEGVDGITQILQTMGADLRVSVAGADAKKLFRNCPKR